MDTLTSRSIGGTEITLEIESFHLDTNLAHSTCARYLPIVSLTVPFFLCEDGRCFLLHTNYYRQCNESWNSFLYDIEASSVA